jgi:sterol desaturase/sphingolipid hydroxylase (fatty acid hydroxylase superfamily)
MSTWQSVGLPLILIQGVFLALDIRHAHRSGGFDLPMRALVFLAATWGLYFAIQMGAVWLLPETPKTLDRLHGSLGMPSSRGNLPGTSLWIVLPILFFLVSFWDYVTHRWVLHTRAFWLLHENHHLPRRVESIMPGISVRPFAPVTTFLILVCTAASYLLFLRGTGTPLGDLRQAWPLLPILTTLGAATHSSHLRSRPRVHHVMRSLLLTTPQEHILHHGIGRQCNYGNYSTLWDRLFGTYVDPLTVNLRSVETGLDYDQDFLGAISLGKLRFPLAWRDRFHLDVFSRLASNPKEVST